MRALSRFAACVVAVTVTAVCSAGPAADRPSQDEPRAGHRLTPASRQLRLALPARPGTPSTLVLRVVGIRNPDHIPISLDVALAPCSTDPGWEPERVTTYGVFPDDQPASYDVSIDAALGRLEGRGIADAKDVCLQVVLRHARGAELTGPLEIALAALEWRDAK